MTHYDNITDAIDRSRSHNEIAEGEMVWRLGVHVLRGEE